MPTPPTKPAGNPSPLLSLTFVSPFWGKTSMCHQLPVHVSGGGLVLKTALEDLYEWLIETTKEYTHFGQERYPILLRTTFICIKLHARACHQGNFDTPNYLQVRLALADCQKAAKAQCDTRVDPLIPCRVFPQCGCHFLQSLLVSLSCC